MGRLTAAGLVHVLPISGEARYGLSDHAHGHAICSACARVQELSDNSLATIMRAAEQEPASRICLPASACRGYVLIVRRLEHQIEANDASDW
jgi:hypothetical protein